MFDQKLCRKKLRETRKRVDFLETVMDLAAICDPDVEEKREKMQRWLKTSAFYTDEFEERNQKWFGSYLDRENLRMRIYYLYGMYLYQSNKPIQAVRSIPDHILCRDADFCRVASINALHEERARQSVNGYAQEFRTYTRLNDEAYEALCLAIACVGYCQCRLQEERIKELTDVFSCPPPAVPSGGAKGLTG